jgi:oxygen-dependent protoporphyrinogen oxidase
MANPLRVVIAGGGITGLVAAYTLQRQVRNGAPNEVQITLLEESSRLGGKIQTMRFAGTIVDAGAEAIFLQDEGRQLLQELDLIPELIVSQASRTNIWIRERLRPLPAGLVAGIPTDLFSILRSGILSPQGILRAGMDLVLPRSRLTADPTVQEVIGSRFGKEVVAHLIEPLLGGIHAGKAEHLSLAAVAPQILTAARAHRSLLLGLRSSSRAGQRGSGQKSNAPQLSSFVDGLDRLIKRLHECLEGTDIRLGNRLQAITRRPDGTYHLSCEGGGELEAEHVLLAIPAWEAARLLSPLDAASAQELGTITHASVTVTHLAYRRSTLTQEQMPGSGFLVPRAEGRLMNACSWVTKKWPRPGSSDLILLRCSAGRAGDERASQMNDHALVKNLHAELVEALGVQEPPVETCVTRWERALPQYHARHQASIQQIEMRLAQRLPGLLLAGAAYHGVGLAACIKDGARAATQIVNGFASWSEN